MPVVTLSKLNSVTQDTFVESFAPTNTQGTSTVIRVGHSSSPGNIRGLLKFDLGLVPNDAIINSATLKLKQSYTNNGAGGQLDIHKITGIWDNSTNWNTQPPFDTTPSASFTVAANGLYTVDIKNLVQDWVNGATNNGLLIKRQDESVVHYVEFDSFDHTTNTNRPILEIDYTIPTTGKKQVEYVGQSNSYSSAEVSSITPTIPTGAVSGDYLIAHWIIYSETSTFALPPGWSLLSNGTGQAWRYVIAYKKMQTGETAPTFQITSAAKYTTIVLYAFRNVKSVLNTSQANTGTVTAYMPPAPINVSVDKALFVLSNWNAIGYTATPPLSYAEKEDFQNARGGFEMSIRYLHTLRTQTVSDMTTTLNAASNGVAGVFVLEPITNNPPTLTLTSPSNNLVLSEGNTLQIGGSATDSDSGNVVTIKYKVNNGTARALQSGVSNGSTPISFAKTLTYSNKRLWDGATDVVGADLAEGTNHTLAVWAEDDQPGGVSSQVTRTFTVIHNRPPTISGSNTNLGTISTPPSQTYTVTEPEGDGFTVTEKINGQLIRTFAGGAGRQETVTIPHDKWIRLDLDTPHTLTVEATDSKGLMSTRTYTFVRTETHIEFMLDFDNPDVAAHFTLDGMPERVLVTLEKYLPTGAEIESVKVCNNAFDASPTWEDATSAVRGGRGYLFTNTVKTAADWGINIWVVLAKGTAAERVLLNGYGGAFD
ncbi:DNRLRE domain-containing protein [Brevibacillus sp. SAFN-007a]|uniref:DNRLRE domain-containing protein n=1 Tax=Brevibacillus sp. SAFN-007a TaxID=3436862 RepID=UPI003F81CB28